MADAFSRRKEDTGALLAISAPSFTLYEQLQAEIVSDPTLIELREQLEEGQLGAQWGYIDGLLTFGDRSTFWQPQPLC